MAEKKISFVESKEVESDTRGESSRDGVGDDRKQTEAYGTMETSQDETMKKLEVQNEAGQEENEKNKQPKWTVGDKCKCKYSQDGRSYEADIIKMNEEKGTCIIKYIGYENKEKVSLSMLMDSDGESARSAQIQQSEAEEELLMRGSEDEAAQIEQSEAEEESLMSASEDETMESASEETSDSEGSTSSSGSGLIPTPPPPPPRPPRAAFQTEEDYEVLGCMLHSWYRSGFYAGYYKARKDTKEPF